jgi:hypothetical protein
MRIRIRDRLDPGSGMAKFGSGIRNKHPGSATLNVFHQKLIFNGFRMVGGDVTVTWMDHRQPQPITTVYLSKFRRLLFVWKKQILILIQILDNS